MRKHERSWDAKEWEGFALTLVQMRHGAHNVQKVPDLVNGDAGVEFFTTDGCLYQCYAPTEVYDNKKASGGMKRKATDDLEKLKKNELVIKGLLGNIKINRWILLCPFLDDKAVISHLNTKVSQLNCTSLSFVTKDFIALVQCQDDFSSEIARLRNQSSGIPLKVLNPSEVEIEEASKGLTQIVDDKLARGFPSESTNRRVQRRNRIIQAHLRRSNLVEQLKREFPDLWESWFASISAEELRLEMIGRTTGPAEEILAEELARLEQSLKSAVGTLQTSSITLLASGQIGAWLIECPLNFSTQGS